MSSQNPGSTPPPPSPLLALAELPRAVAELGLLMKSLPWLATARKGDGHPVLVLPGFAASDGSTVVLRSYLRVLGYDVHTWDLGANLGPRSVGREGEKLVARLRAIHERTRKRVSVIGWSLGGILARLVSRKAPDAVRQVITLGSPFAGSPRSTNTWRAYELLSGQKIDDAHTQEQLRHSATPPPVPATAIWSRTDGVVAWQNCVEVPSSTTENIEVYGSHCGLGLNSAVLFAVADRLSLTDGEWMPFDRHGLRALAYPSSGHPRPS